jgi:hypothetical protein
VANSVVVLDPLNQYSPYRAPVLRSNRLAGTVKRPEQQPIRAIEIQCQVAVQVAGQLMTSRGDQPDVSKGLCDAQLLEPNAQAFRPEWAEGSAHLPLRPTEVRQRLVIEEHVHAAYRSIINRIGKVLLENS